MSEEVFLLADDAFWALGLHGVHAVIEIGGLLIFEEYF